MKKMLWIAGLTLALAGGVVGTAYAHEAQDPPGPGTGGWQQLGEGPLHDLLVQAAAKLLGLDPAEVEARLVSGQTLAQIALDEGWTLEQFRLQWRQARRAVVEKALQDGLLTRDQLRRMTLHRAYRQGRHDCQASPGFDGQPGLTPTTDGT